MLAESRRLILVVSLCSIAVFLVFAASSNLRPQQQQLPASVGKSNDDIRLHNKQSRRNPIPSDDVVAPSASSSSSSSPDRDDPDAAPWYDKMAASSRLTFDRFIADPALEAQMYDNHTLQLVHPWYSTKPAPLVVKTLCEPYTWHPPLNGLYDWLPGCQRNPKNVFAGNLVAVRIPNWNSREERQRLLRYGDATVTRCIKAERRMVDDVLFWLSVNGRNALVKAFETAKKSWSVRRAGGVDDDDDAVESRSEKNASVVDKNTKNAKQSRSKKKKRILITAALRWGTQEPRHPSDAMMMALWTTFMRVARLSTDELHIITDYDLGEWNKVMTKVRRREHRRRLRRKLRKELYDDHEDANSVSPAASSSNNNQEQLLFAPRVKIIDCSKWPKREAWPPAADEPPLNSRVWLLDYYFSRVLKDETDDTVSMIMCVDSRDVVLANNPFDAIEALNLNGGAATTTTTFRGIFIAEEETNIARRMQMNYQPWAANVNSVWMQSIVGRGGFEQMFSWALPSLIKKTTAKNGTYGSSTSVDTGNVPFYRENTREPNSYRRKPNLQPLQVLCSGTYGGSMQALRDYQRLYKLVLACNDAGGGGQDHMARIGVDQGATNVAWYLGITASSFPHPAFVLDSGFANPIKHFHYFQPDAFKIEDDGLDRSVGPRQGSSFQMTNCAGRKLALLHQLDRQPALWNDFQRSNNKITALDVVIGD